MKDDRSTEGSVGTEDKRVGSANERAACPEGVKDTVLEGRACNPKVLPAASTVQGGVAPKHRGTECPVTIALSLLQTR